MPVWAKLDTAIHRNPKVRRAGSDAREVFILLICINREQGFDGKIPPRYVEDSYLARELQWGRSSRAAAAVLKCDEAGLIALHGLSSGVDPASNFVELCGWDVEWRTSRDESRERVRKFRAKGTESKSAVTGCNGVTPSEESREDQRRAEKSVAASAAPARQATGDLFAVDAPEPALRRSRKQAAGDHAAFIARFSALYEADAGAKPTWGGKEGRWVSELVAAHGLVELERRAVAMFAAPADHWLRRGGALTMGTFRQHVDVFAKPAAESPPPARQARARGPSDAITRDEMGDLTEYLRSKGQ